MDNFDPTNSTDVEALKEYYAAQASTSMTQYETQALIPIYIVIGLIILAALVLAVISLWKLFKKADEKPWKAIIPVYNFYIVAKICNRKISFWITLGLAILSIVLSPISYYFDGDTISIVCDILLIAAQIAWTVFFIFILNGLSHAFSHGKGYTVGLYFLQLIFLCILAFGKSKYSPEAVFINKK